MPEVKHLKLEPAEADEKDIQQAFEKEIGEIDDTGLRYVDSFFHIGTGYIDTVALDDEGNPVLIEFKKPGTFDRDALFQLMNYYSWFASDENHLRHLRELVEKKLPSAHPPLDEWSIEDIRLIAVVSDLSDEIKNACYAVRPSVEVVQYRLGKVAMDGSLRVVITSVFAPEEETQGEVKPLKSLESHFKTDSMHQLFDELLAKVKGETDSAVEIRSRQNYISIAAPKGRGFLGVRVRKTKLQLDARGTFSDGQFKPWMRGTSWGPAGSGGRVPIWKSSDITPALMSWIKGSFATA